ncbi:NmrA/HSCARG family protein [Desertivirga brevis]|uniref:NmrA/HSCARG family protein n=1 Tax=Desertivirga brevis TaxID=2810310 RepID=UPI001A95921A|nr:NmrA/HSCARG family protein [Pedobacter sp. SYSU D00873]
MNPENEKPLVTVTGVLGKQGLSVAHSLLNSGQYRVRGITRRADTPEGRKLKALGVELKSIPLSVGYEQEYIEAFKGSDSVFLITPAIAPPESYEFELGKQLADAALEAGVKHVIFSSLENVSRITGNRKFAPHFTDKARVEEYIRTLPFTSTFIYMAFFYTNLIEFYTPILEGDTLVFPIYLPRDFSAPFVDPLTATGPAVLEILSNRQEYAGKALPVIGEVISPQKMVEAFSKVTGKKAVYKSAYTREEFLNYFPSFKSNDELVDEILGMAEYAVEFGYFQKDRDWEWSRRINPGTLSWEQFLRNTGWQGEKYSY